MRSINLLNLLNEIIHNDENMKNKKKYLISYLAGISIIVVFFITYKVQQYLEMRDLAKLKCDFTEEIAQRSIKISELSHLKTRDSSFDMLAVYYRYTPLYQMHEMLSIAMIMANKYNYGEAYYLTYSRLLYRRDSSEKIDSLTLKIGISYLKAAARLNNKDAQKRLGEYYMEGEFVKKDTVLGNKLCLFLM